jgi:pimeloyl-ACP methyl ester carboxylesterase
MEVIIKNLAIEYSDQGSGPVMFFLHGWKDNLHTFDALMPILAKQHRIIRLDLPGFGASELPQTAWNLSDYIEFVKDFIDKFNLEVEVLIGHSFGGRISIKAVANKIIKPKKLVLIASAGIAKTRTMRNIIFYLLAQTGKAVTLLPPLIFWRTSLRKKLYAIAGSDYFSAGLLKETFLKVVKEDLSGLAAKINIPTLLLWGNRDRTTPLTDGRRLSEIIPASKLEIISGAGHLVHQEKPDKIAELINQFAL